MKKLIALILVFVCLLGLVGCGAGKRGDENDAVRDSNSYIVLEATESTLLVAAVGEDGKALKSMQYSVPNWFEPSTEIKAGYELIIKHNGVVRETFPMQFDKIYSMEYWDRESGLSTVVTVD